MKNKSMYQALLPTLTFYLLLWAPLKLQAETVAHLKGNTHINLIPSAIKQFKVKEQTALKGIGKVELIKHQCLSLTTHQSAEQVAKNTVKPACVVFWQWIDRSTWSISLSVIDNNGNTLASEGFGRSAMLLGIVPYSAGSLIIVEHGVQQGGDVSCCPSKMNISVFRWFQGALERLSQSELAETNRHL